MIEIMRSCGLQEGVHKYETLETDWWTTALLMLFAFGLVVRLILMLCHDRISSVLTAL